MNDSQIIGSMAGIILMLLGVIFVLMYEANGANPYWLVDAGTIMLTVGVLATFIIPCFL